MNGAGRSGPLPPRRMIGGPTGTRTLDPFHAMEVLSQLSYQHTGPKVKGGGPTGTRTPDPLLAKEVLSQLSYQPTRREVIGGPTRT